MHCSEDNDPYRHPADGWMARSMHKSEFRTVNGSRISIGDGSQCAGSPESIFWGTGASLGGSTHSLACRVENLETYVRPLEGPRT